jgi:CDP-diacylglycerol--serine O-phosphatidyltransferase
MAVISIFSDQLALVPLFIAISLLADYSDGLVARLLKVSSPMGRELDSLADMVSFGVVPGAMLFYMINQAEGIEMVRFFDTNTMLGLVGFIVTVFSCVRLAKFNLDTRQTEGFVGLNTPACTIFVLGILLMTIDPVNHYGLQKVWTNTPFLITTSFVLAYLLIAEIPMFSFKFKSLKLNENKIRFSFIIITVACLATFKFGAALSIIILNYILISVVLWLGGKLKREKREF